MSAKKIKLDRSEWMYDPDSPLGAPGGKSEEEF